MGSAILATRGLRKSHGSGEACVEALRGVDLDIAAGEFVAVTGPSGSGKTTLLHLLAGLDRPTSGRILLDGVDIGRLTDDERTQLRRHHIGLVFQAFQLLDMLTAEENVGLPLAIAGCPAAQVRRQVQLALDWVGLAHRSRHRPGQLSGGEQQRVAIARALAIHPLLLLADEPTGNLDTVHGERIIALLRRLVQERGQTVLMVTHDPAHAALADRTLCLRDGCLLQPAAASPEPETAYETVDLCRP